MATPQIRCFPCCRNNNCWVNLTWINGRRLSSPTCFEWPYLQEWNSMMTRGVSVPLETAYKRTSWTRTTITTVHHQFDHEFNQQVRALGDSFPSWDRFPCVSLSCIGSWVHTQINAPSTHFTQEEVALAPDSFGFCHLGILWWTNVALENHYFFMENPWKSAINDGMFIARLVYRRVTITITRL